MDLELAREIVALSREQLAVAAGQNANVQGHAKLLRGITQPFRSVLADLEPSHPGITERAVAAFTQGYDEAEAELSQAASPE